MAAPEDNKPASHPEPGEEDIDLSLLEESLRLTPWQRLVENERALALVRMLEAAAAQTHGPAKPNS